MTFIRAKKHLWQNFLRNSKILEMIVWDKSLEDTHVIEVGPGPGDLTGEIIKRSPKSLTLIELDSDMIPLLQERFSEGSLQIYLNDVLDINIVETKKSQKENTGIRIISDRKTIELPPYHVYGNIPYYITSPIIHHFLYEVDLRPEVMIFTMQKEVAERILARDGCHSVLSLSCQLVADIEKICDISPNNFVPAPKVWSTCLRFTTRVSEKVDAKKILALIKKGFSQKRKKLFTNLIKCGYDKKKTELVFKEQNLSENTRAEELSLDQWRELYLKLHLQD